jgi:hypothetical protein
MHYTWPIKKLDKQLLQLLLLLMLLPICYVCALQELWDQGAHS